MQFYSLRGYYWWSHHASISKTGPSSSFIETFLRTQQWHKLPLSFLARPGPLLDEAEFVRCHPRRVFHAGGRLCEKVTDVHALARLAWCDGPGPPSLQQQLCIRWRPHSTAKCCCGRFIGQSPAGSGEKRYLLWPWKLILNMGGKISQADSN